MLSKLSRQASRVRTFASEVPVVPLYLGGKHVQSKATKFVDINDPSTGELIAKTPISTQAEMEAATDAAAEAFKTWSEVSVSQRARVMHILEGLIRERTDDLAKCITREQGKTLADAKGDVFRGLEVVEHACSFPSLILGESLPSVAQGVDTVSWRRPLGVCAGITPFNFPAMVPLWMFPVAATAGNTFVLKPSERVPLTSMMLADLAAEAGLPAGVLNVIHGQHDAVNYICDEPRIKAVSFVGGDRAGRHIYARCAEHGKRAQCNMGAKNHAIVMPDADPESVSNMLAGASVGAAGQRCMAISVAVMVGGANKMIDRIAAKAAKLKVGHGLDADIDMGPMVSGAARDRAVDLIASGVQQGAELLVDGRNPSVPDQLKGGYWLGPSVFRGVKAGMRIYDEEIFGPCLCIVEVDTVDEAIAFVNANKYGNGAAVFTRSGALARKVTFELDAGQIGVNLPIPVPLPMFSFTGNKASVASDLNFYGKAGLQFYTQLKTVTSSWKDDQYVEQLNVTMPTMK